ncbi:MAG: cytochrome b [Rhizorhabdus sp.]|uniref:cytochrome b n=1 Tax=Rhizorhabdus sp. TaxID=1968843 RepID=UPI001B3E3FC5|nr:cytochrome b [Rhizorhabdus sp.]MBP8231331.1 cytochrome b [Rhizorhabdus sp.]
MSKHGFPASARLLHWVMAALILSMLFLGVSMVTSLSGWHDPAILLHKSFGILVLLLAAVRLLNRLRFTAPPLPADLSPLQALAAKASHWLLYAGMFAVPLSGWAMQSAAGTPVRPFGLFTLPPLTAPDLACYGWLREAHFLMTWGLFALLLVHIGAALHHGWVRRDGVLQSMLRGD